MKITAQLIIIFFTTLQVSGQKVWTSPKYSYSIWTPPSFTVATATGKNIDYKVTNSDGSSLLVNVTPRQANEFGFSPHDYTKVSLEKEIKQFSPASFITFFEKIYINQQKAIIYHCVNNNLKSVEGYVFVDDRVYMITATAGAEQFNKHLNDFTKAIKSIKF